MNRADLCRRIVAGLMLCLLALGLALTPRPADAFPVAGKPVVLILPAIGGSTGDRVLRLFADKLKDDWKVPVIVDAKPGAGGAIGTEYVARAAPDGHTILLGFSHLVQAPAFELKRPYDTFRDFIPVARITDLPMLLQQFFWPLMGVVFLSLLLPLGIRLVQMARGRREVRPA